MPTAAEALARRLGRILPRPAVGGAVSLLGGVMMMRTVKGPKWMLIELPLYLVLAYVAAVIAGPA